MECYCGCGDFFRFFQQYGFNIPLLFKDKTGLGLRVPSSDFSIKDVRMCVGSKRMLDVMDVNTQKNLRMTMKEWQQYYEDPDKTRLLNVISLEFSHTKLVILPSSTITHKHNPAQKTT